MKKILYIIFSLLFITACNKESYNYKLPDDTEQICERGKLRVVTLESAISYYTRDGDEFGFDYALAQNLADYLDLPLQMVVASTIEEMKEILMSGKADFAAYKLPGSKEIRDNFLVTDVETMSNVVLVQPNNRQKITNLTQLIGREVFVQKHTKYYTRLKHLNNEIGGGIIIKYLSDTLTVDEILYDVSQNKIPFTVTDDDIAALGKKYFKNLDVDLPVSVTLPKAWVVRKNAPLLADTINAWYSDIKKSKFLKRLTDRYLNQSSYFDNFKPIIPKDHISPYDDIFRANAPLIGWDWRLLAAVAYNESRFYPNAVSPKGAMGVMQMMYGTGVKYGLNDSTFFVPKDNIEAGTKLLVSLNNMFSAVKDSSERIKVILAAYNAGQGHIFDAIALTKKYGSDAQKWDGHIGKFLLLKSNPQYYNDEVAKLGYFRANYTIRFVNDVLATFNEYKRTVLSDK